MATMMVTYMLVPLVNSISSEYDYLYSQDYPDNADDITINEQEIVNLDKPDFVTVGGIIMIQEGTKVVMPCQVNGLGGRQTLWTKMPGVVAEEDQLFVGAIKLIGNPRMNVAELSDEGGTIITITAASIEDSGKYTCRIADNRLDQSLVFTLQVAPEYRKAEQTSLRSKAVRSWLVSIQALVILIVTVVTLTR